MYPLFTEDLIALIRRLMSPDKQKQIGTAIVLSARLGR
jgi:hypothetical protein